MVTGEIANAAVVASRYIGGVYVSRAVDGQPGAGAPFTPVPLAEQQRAMQLLRTKFFAPDAWSASPALLAELQPPRRGFSGPGDRHPRPGARGPAGGADVPAGPADPGAAHRFPSLRQPVLRGPVMSDLTDAVFAADARGNVNTSGETSSSST